MSAGWCPTCQGYNRETADMVCMTCGRDYMPADGSDESAPGLGWKRLMSAWREQCKQAELERDDARRTAETYLDKLAELEKALTAMDNVMFNVLAPSWLEEIARSQRTGEVGNP